MDQGSSPLGLEPAAYGTHTMRCTKATLIGENRNVVTCAPQLRRPFHSGEDRESHLGIASSPISELTHHCHRQLKTGTDLEVGQVSDSGKSETPVCSDLQNAPAVTQPKV